MDFTGYKKTVVATTDRVKIIMMLYEASLNHIRLARQKIQEGDILSKGPHMRKVTSIVSELSNVLDMEKGGEISTNLRDLYSFVLQRLLNANLHNDLSALEDAENVLSVLKDAWKEMMEQGNHGQTEEVTASSAAASF